MSHTPGPWEYVPKLTASENHKGFFIRAEKAARNGKWALADVQPGDQDGHLGEANARLIAAAPELLEALSGLFERFAHGEAIQTDQWILAGAAIDKATGDTL